MSKRLDWDDTRVFLALARSGTLLGAADLLRASPATISRRIERMERALDVPLFSRHQSGYRLTDQGEALMSQAEAVELAVHGLRRTASRQGDVAGLVRVASMTSLVSPIVVPALAPLLASNPRLDIEILNGPETVNLHRRDADLALRMVRPERGNLTVRTVGHMGFGLYGPPDGSRPDRLVTWPDQSAFQTVLGWARALGADRASRLAVNTPDGQVDAVALGAGIAVLPHLLAKPAGLSLLQDHLPDGTQMRRELFLVAHADLTSSRRVSAVADYLVAAMDARQADLAGQ